MIEQQGQVVAAGDGRVSVRLGGRSGCSACDAGKGCGAGVFGRLLQRRPVVMDFENRIGADSGQAVMVGLPESLFLRLVTRLYLLPLLAGLAGAVAGFGLASQLQSGPLGADLATLAGALAAGGLAFRWIRAKKMEFPARSAVHLLRILDQPAIGK